MYINLQKTKKKIKKQNVIKNTKNLEENKYNI